MSEPRAEDALLGALGVVQDLELDAEVYIEDGRRIKVTVSEGKVESVEDREDRGLGIRVFCDGRVGFSFTTDVAPEAVRRSAQQAREIARHAGRDEAWRLPTPAEAPPLPFPNEDEAGRRLEMSERIRMAGAMEEAALRADPRVRRTRQAAYMDFHGEVHIAHTGGLSAGYRYCRSVAHVEVTATEGDASQSGFHAEFGLGAKDIDAAEVGRQAAGKALGKLGAKPARTGRVPAVLDREVVAGLLEALSPAFSARRVIKGTSLLRGALGQSIASRAVNLVEDPRLPGGYGSAPVDGEGVPTRTLTLIEGGTLQSYLYDSYAAAKLGQGRPGNAVRGSYGSLPQIGPTNLLLQPGSDSRDSLLERAGSGVWIGEVMGLHTVDPISGDFSLGGNGRLIEGGRLGPPIDQIAFSGNLLGLLRSVEAVGSDLKLFPGAGGAPSVLLAELSVAGAS